MTIITLDHDCASDEWQLAEQLIRYEHELAIRRLEMRFIGASAERMHFVIPTRTTHEHFSVIRLAKLIFQDLFVF